MEALAVPDSASNKDSLPDLEIRLFGPDDSVSDLTSLLNRAYKRLADMNLRYVATWQDNDITLKRIKNAECYVGLLDGKLVAAITFKKARQSEGTAWYDRPDVAKFSQLAVEPDLQGRGLGSQMLQHVENRARETGATELALDTAEPAKHLIEWYEHRGYRFIEYADWDVTNYRSMIMSKML